MKVEIRQADLQLDRRVIIDTALRFLTVLSSDSRFNWLYESNANGRARVWLAYSAADGAVIGMAGAFPRRICIRNREEMAWVLGDFCIGDQYRSLGPALQLQRACLSVLETTQAAFCYDFPSASMLAVYTRLGLSEAGKMVRLAKPLRVDRKVKEIIKNPAAQRFVASVGNRLLKIPLPKAATDETLELSVYTQRFGEEFTAFAKEQRGKFGICLQRSADYLNWRYSNNPFAHHEIVTARRNGRLAGYVVWTQTNEDASIVDLFGEENAGMFKRLVGEIVARALKRGVVTLSVLINESHPWRSLFTEMGFRPRDSCPVVIIPSKTFPHKIDPQLTGWYLMQGDRDS